MGLALSSCQWHYCPVYLALFLSEDVIAGNLFAVVWSQPPNPPKARHRDHNGPPGPPKTKALEGLFLFSCLCIHRYSSLLHYLLPTTELPYCIAVPHKIFLMRARCARRYGVAFPHRGQSATTLMYIYICQHRIKYFIGGRNVIKTPEANYRMHMPREHIRYDDLASLFYLISCLTVPTKPHTLPAYVTAHALCLLRSIYALYEDTKARTAGSIALSTAREDDRRKG